MSKISEYLEAGRKDKIYDPNRGMYIDPNTGEAFVPTFTNDPNSNIMNRVQSRMANPQGVQTPQQGGQPQGGGMPQRQGQPLDMSQGAYLIKERQQGAIPERGQEQRKAPDPRDPWAMANEHMKSPQFMTEVYKQMFPGRNPSQGFKNQEERNMFYKGLQSTRNALVDRFKWQIDQKNRQKEQSLKYGAKGMSQKDLITMIQGRTNEIVQEGVTSGMPVDRAEAQKQAQQEITSLLESTGQILGKAQGGGMPVDKVGAMGEPGQDQPASKAQPAGADAKPAEMPKPGDSGIKILGAEGSHKKLADLANEPVKQARGLTAIKEALRLQFPDAPDEELNKMRREYVKTNGIPEEFTKYDLKEMMPKLKAALDSAAKKRETDPMFSGYSLEEMREMN